MGIFGPLVGPVLVSRPDLPIHRIIVQGISVFMHYVFSVALVCFSVSDLVISRLIAIFPLLDLFIRLLVLRLSLPVGFDFRRCGPSLEVRQIK